MQRCFARIEPHFQIILHKGTLSQIFCYSTVNCQAWVGVYFTRRKLMSSRSLDLSLLNRFVKFLFVSVYFSGQIICMTYCFKSEQKISVCNYITIHLQYQLVAHFVQILLKIFLKTVEIIIILRIYSCWKNIPFQFKKKIGSREQPVLLKMCIQFMCFYLNSKQILFHYYISTSLQLYSSYRDYV